MKDKIVKEAKSSNPLDENELDADLLQADFLETKELEFNELDVSYLDEAIFEDFLRSDDPSASDGVIPGQNPVTGVITIKQDPNVEVIRMSSKATFNIKFVEETGINTTAIQGDITINIITLDGQSSNFIRLIQQ